MKRSRASLALTVLILIGLVGVIALPSLAEASAPPLALDLTSGPAGTTITVTLPTACTIPAASTGPAGVILYFTAVSPGSDGSTFMQYPENPGDTLTTVALAVPTTALPGHFSLTGICFTDVATAIPYGAVLFEVTGGPALPSPAVDTTSGPVGTVISVSGPCAPAPTKPSAVFYAVLFSAMNPDLQISNLATGIGPTQTTTLTVPIDFPPGPYLIATSCFDYLNTATFAEVNFTVTGSGPGDSVSVVLPLGGGTVSTPKAPSSSNPVQTTLSASVAGAVSITEGPTSLAPPTGYAFGPFQVDISAPVSTAAAPLTLRFALDGSALVAPLGTSAASIVLFRDGVPIAACTDPTAVVAAPDPCVFARTDTAGGAELGVYTSHASAWNFGAALAPPPIRTLGVTVAGSGSVVSLPAGISCSTACIAAFADGTNVDLTASPSPGSTFTGWSGACSGTSSCTVAMTADRSVTATFSTAPPPPPPTAKIEVEGKGRLDGWHDPKIEVDVARKRSGRLKGEFEFRTHRPRLEFESSKVLTLDASGNTAMVTGTGELNGHHGYSFVVVVVDNHDDRSTPDRIAIEVKDRTGSVVYTTDGTQALKKGDLDIEID